MKPKFIATTILLAVSDGAWAQVSFQAGKVGDHQRHAAQKLLV